MARKRETGLFKREGASVYEYDFQIAGHRFCGSTGLADRREAETIVKARKAEARAGLADRRSPHMTFGAASSLWWHEVGQYLKGQTAIMAHLARLQSEIGMNTRLCAIDDAAVARMVAKRRAEGIAPATVNRSIPETLRRIIRRAADVWHVETGRISWGQHILREPRERVRELSADEEARLMDALRPAYRDIVQFALMSGCRLGEIVGLTWGAIDWGNRRIAIMGKGDVLASIPLSNSIRALIWPMQGRHASSVFCYPCTWRDDAGVGHHWKPVTYSGLSSEFRRARVRAGIPSGRADPVAGFRFHDTRHTTATRILRETGNIKIVQKLLRHSRIETSARYAHVLDDEVSAAMDNAQKSTPPLKNSG